MARKIKSEVVKTGNVSEVMPDDADVIGLRAFAVRKANEATGHWQRGALACWEMGVSLIKIRASMEHHGKGKKGKTEWGNYLEAFCNEIDWSHSYVRNWILAAEEYKSPEQFEGFTKTQMLRFAGIIPDKADKVVHKFNGDPKPIPDDGNDDPEPKADGKGKGGKPDGKDKGKGTKDDGKGDPKDEPEDEENDGEGSGDGETERTPEEDAVVILDNLLDEIKALKDKVALLKSRGKIEPFKIDMAYKELMTILNAVQNLPS